MPKPSNRYNSKCKIPAVSRVNYYLLSTFPERRFRCENERGGKARAVEERLMRRRVPAVPERDDSPVQGSSAQTSSGSQPCHQNGSCALGKISLILWLFNQLMSKYGIKKVTYLDRWVGRLRLNGPPRLSFPSPVLRAELGRRSLRMLRSVLRFSICRLLQTFTACRTRRRAEGVGTVYLA